MTNEPVTNGKGQSFSGPRPANETAGKPPAPDPGPGAGAVLEWEPRLVEEAVLVALRGHEDEAAFRGERDRLYEIKDPEGREAAFRGLHAAWFGRLGLGRPVLGALDEQPSIAAATHGCRVSSARSRKEEGAELFVRPSAGQGRDPERRWVVIRLRPEALGAPDALMAFLRHELFHIADMLDPYFAYEPSLPPAPAGPAHAALQRDRYRVLWDAAIDGRLVRLGRAPSSLREERLKEFARTFPMLGPAVGEAFARIFDGEGHIHAALVAYATIPDALAFSATPGRRLPCSPGPDAASPVAAGPRPGERCAICRFPTHAFEPHPTALPGETLALIRTEFPAWHPAQGLCRQCADLYRSRSQAKSPVCPAAA